MKQILTIIICLFATQAFTQVDINIDPNQKAKLYFTEAEKRYNQNEYKTALDYIIKAENELGETNGRILNLKVKVLYNDGQFEQAQKALALFINNYATTVTPEMKAETESYFLKLERYFEMKQEEENKQLAENRKKAESLKHYKYVGCSNSSCSGGQVNDYYYEDCGNCEGTGRVTQQNYANAISNGLNGTNYPTSTRVTCTRCNGARQLRQVRKINCSTCNGSAKLLKYSGSDYIPSSEQEYAIKYKKSEIDYYIKLRSEIANKPNQKLFSMKEFSTEKYGFCDRNLKLIIPYNFDNADVISDYAAIVKSNSKYGIISNENKLLLPVEYSEIRKLSASSLLLKKLNNWYLSDYKGKQKGENVESFLAYGDYLMVFKKDSKIGVMDFEGNIVEKPTYDEHEVISWRPFLVAFKTGYSWRLKKLTSTISDPYNESFTEIKKYTAGSNSVILLRGIKSKLANVDGSLISSEGFSSVEYNEKLGMFVLQQGSYYGLYDIANGSFVAPRYSALYLNANNPQRALIMSNGLYGVIDSRGNSIIPAVKNRIWFSEGKNQFIVREKEGSRKRYVYSEDGRELYDYKSDN
jgi:hypothetical protein